MGVVGFNLRFIFAEIVVAIMRLSPFLLLLPALAVALDQIPLGTRVQGWLDKAKSYLPTATPTPIQKTTPKVIEKSVTPLNLSNWQTVLEPSSHVQDWLIFITGGNKTCLGRCENAEKAFNASVPLFAVDPTSPNLAYLNCENDKILCSIWVAGAPYVWHLQVPQVSTEEPRLPYSLHIVALNSTTVTPETIYKIHSEQTYQNVPLYDGALHPFDGWLAQYGLNVPLGYLMFGFSAVPTWVVMIAVSYFSRTYMSRRMANPGAIAGRPAQGGAN